MKKITKRIVLLLMFTSTLSSFGLAFEQQGFSEYQENNKEVSFLCQNQCFLLLGDLANNDVIKIHGDINGNGIFGYGFLVGQQVAPGEMVQVSGPSSIDTTYIFSKNQLFDQIPKEAKILLVFQGNVGSQAMSIQLGKLGFGEKTQQLWKDFWTIEPITPYSINLRYGVKLIDTSLIKIGYIVFVLLAIFILSGQKFRKKRIETMLYLGISIFFFIGVRNLITYISITTQGLQQYTFASPDTKSFFDLGDYIVFTEKIRETLELDTTKESCKFFVDSFQDRPFKSHWGSVYLKPCELVATGSIADYLIYYKKPISEIGKGKQVLIDFNGSFLLQNKGF